MAAKYDINTTTLGELLEDPQCVEIMEKHVPGITSNPMISMGKTMPVGQVLGMAGGMIGQDKIDAMRAEIEAIEA